MPENEETNLENEYDSESDCSEASFLSYLSSANEDDDDDDDDDHPHPPNHDSAQHLHLQDILTSTLFKSPPPTELPTLEEANQVLIICNICVQAKETRHMFRNLQCDHSFCYECVTKHVATKIQETITVIPCPVLNCMGVLDIDACRVLLPKEFFDRWNDALCDAPFLAVPKFYCPYKDCSATAMMILDNGIKKIGRSECPFCHGLFCARCYVPWHHGVMCEEFQKLNEDESGREDLLVKELVNEKQWSMCPQCKFNVEKIEGCLHITCRCKFEFCYRCGEPWTSSTHGGCQRN